MGMCERVRTRNTLYEVGARKSLICYDAVERRKEKKRKKRKMRKKRKCENMKILKKMKSLIKQEY